MKRGKRKEEGVGGNIDPTSKEWRKRKRGDAGAAIRNYCIRFYTKKEKYLITIYYFVVLLDKKRLVVKLRNISRVAKSCMFQEK